MKPAFASPLLVLVTLVLAGCVGPPGEAATPTPTPDTPPTAASTTALPASPSTSAEAARQRALNAERSRVDDVLANDANLTDTSVGGYGETDAEVAERGDPVTVRVTVSYSYQHDCGNRSGFVDGASTVAIYTVTSDAVTLDSVEADVRTPCHQ